MSTDPGHGDAETPMPVSEPLCRGGPSHNDSLGVTVPPRAVDDGEITRSRVTLEDCASENDVNRERRPWWVERDHRSTTERRASSAGPVEARPDARYTHDVLDSTDIGSLFADSNATQHTYSGDSASFPLRDLREDIDDVDRVPDGRITSLIRTYVDGLIAHVVGTFVDGLLVERKQPGPQESGSPTELADDDTERAGDTVSSPDNCPRLSGEHADSAHVDRLTAETFDRETLDICEPCLCSVSPLTSGAARDVFNKEASGESSSVGGPTARAAVLEAGVATAGGTADNRPPYTETTTDAEADIARSYYDGNSVPTDRGIPQPDLIISSSLAAGGCGGGGSPSEVPESDSDNGVQLRRHYSHAYACEFSTVDDNDDNDEHAALVIAEEELRRSFYEELYWDAYYPVDGGNRGSSSDKGPQARQPIGRDAAYRCQTSLADPGGGVGGGWREPADAVAAADSSALSDDVFLASGARGSSSLTASGDNTRTPDNYRADNNYTDTYNEPTVAVTAPVVNAAATGYSSQVLPSDSAASIHVEPEGVGDIEEGRCNRPESRASEGEAPIICFESISPIDVGDRQEQGEIVLDGCVARVASDASDADSTPPSPEVDWHRPSKIVHIPSNFVQSPDCIDVPQVLYRSYSDTAISLLSGPMEPLIETERDVNNGDGESSGDEGRQSVSHDTSSRGRLVLKSDPDVSATSNNHGNHVRTLGRTVRPGLPLSRQRSNVETTPNQQHGFRSENFFIALKPRVAVVVPQLTALSPTQQSASLPPRRAPTSPGPRAKTVTSVAEHDLAIAAALQQTNNASLMRVGSERLAARPTSASIDTRSSTTHDTRGSVTLDTRGSVTPNMARSRPRLPTGLSRTRSVSDQDRHVDDLMGVLNTLGKTNFVRKYGRRMRQSPSGSSSPAASAASPTHSPIVMSPPCQTDAPIITLSRMRNIQMKLEKVKESQEHGNKSQDESEVSNSRSGSYTRKSKSLDDTLSYSGRASSEETECTPEVSTNLLASLPVDSDSMETTSVTSKHKTFTTSEVTSADCSHIRIPRIPDVSVTEPLKNVDDTTATYHVSGTPGSTPLLTPSPSFESDTPSTAVPPRPRLGSGHSDRDADDVSLRLSDYVDDVNRHYVKDNSLETEDEGVGSTDADVQYYKDAYMAVTSHSPLDTRRTQSANFYTTAPGTAAVHISSGDKREGRGRPTTEQGHSGGTGGKLANGRFLTHPPIRDRVSPREGGSVDSNGLGSLRDSFDPSLRTSDLLSQASAISLDSHIGDTTGDAPSYRDVIMDVTSEATDMERLERKNSKTLKQKSKSDPSGEKQKDSSPVDLPTVISAHAHSTPFLTERIDEQRELSEFGRDQKDAPISKSDNLLASTKLTGTGNENFNASLLQERARDAKGSTTDDESSGREMASLTASVGSAKQSRRSTKKRQRGSKFAGKTEKPPTCQKVTTSELSTSRIKFRNSIAARSATAPEIMTPQYPDNTLQRSSSASTNSAESPTRSKTKLTDIRSTLTLPLSSKENALMRNRSTGSFFAGKAERLRSAPGARPKDLPQSSRSVSGGRQTRPNIHDHFDQSEKTRLALGGHMRERCWTSIGSPSLEPLCSPSMLSLFGGTAGDKDKRDLIVQELFSTEQQYVETLKMLVEKYMIPMKTQGILDSNLVDDMFYKINEIYMHHATLLAFMEGAIQSWNSSATIGDIIYKNFSKQTVIESYISFIENFARAEKVLDDLSTKSSFQKFVEQCEKETKTKLPLKAQIVKPAQRIPRYELLLRRLLMNTSKDHPDYEQLQKAEKAIHDLALRINSVRESKHEEDLQETLKKLELLLITDLVAQDRIYLRHDMVQVLNRKDPCCIWLFSDLIVLSFIKRKSGTVNKRSTLMLQAPAGNDFVENVKHKMWLKISLDNLEVVKSSDLKTKRDLVDQEDLEEDFALLTKIAELSTKLTCLHEELSGSVNDLLNSINRQLSEHQLKNPPPEANRVELLATTMERVAHITVVFASPEKRALWESAIMEAKQKLEATVDGKDPEFLHALQITKTRAGMQFSCAAPIDSLNVKQCRDVWVCNSDGYVGHMCLLSLQPEPIVTLNSPVPGCNSRILCICATPAFLKFKRKGSGPRGGSRQVAAPKITVEEDQEDKEEPETEDGYVSDSSSTTSEDLSVIEEEHDAELHRPKSPSPDVYHRPQSPHEQTTVQDPLKSTMWLGTEDGCIHIFPATENMKTTKKKIRLQQSAGVLCIVHLDQKVFVSLANGDLVVYQRDQDGPWDITGAEVVSLGNATSPINKMLAVAGKLWCSCHNEVMVINPSSLELEVTFKASPDPKRGIFCMTCSGLGVWLAPQASSKVYLFHATTYDQLLEVSIAQAVAQKLQTADDIIRQHKTACLRITTLLACKDLLWVGTSAGVILTLPMPKISSTAMRNSFSQPTVTGLVRGHTGHVRFLTCVEMPPSSIGQMSSSETKHRLNRRASITVHTLTMATKMIVISGGDGYEDFRSSATDETAGRDDSTNHLLLWQV